jgi:RNA polymerase sigma-70 factor (ECF subfamily)
MVTQARPAALLPREMPARNESERLTALFHAHVDLVWRFVRRLGVAPDAIDDAVQEVFVVASRRLDAIEAGKEKAFLYGTALRVASQSRRTRSRRREDDVDSAVDNAEAHAPSAEELVDRKRARELLDDIVARMPDDTRDVFVLYELEGLTMAEIAACTNLPAGTVASRLRRGREVFQAAVARIEAATGKVSRHG